MRKTLGLLFVVMLMLTALPFWAEGEPTREADVSLTGLVINGDVGPGGEYEVGAHTLFAILDNVGNESYNGVIEFNVQVAYDGNATLYEEYTLVTSAPILIDADAAGLQLTVHAIGDEANGYLMDMLERIIAVNGPKDRRFRLVHAQVMTDRDIERAGELQIVVEMQPFHTSDDMRWMEERIGRDRSRGAYAFRRLWDSGAVVSFGSDSPGTNASRYYLNPMLGIYAAVTRKTLSGMPEGGWFPKERISVEEAIQAYTFNTAYAAYEEDIKGSLTVGKLADFVVLSDNLLTMNPNDIKNVSVQVTVVGGKVIYER